MRTFGLILMGAGVGVATGALGMSWVVSVAILVSLYGLAFVLENPTAK